LENRHEYGPINNNIELIKTCKKGQTYEHPGKLLHATISKT
jgi:hypothetical protein